MKTIEDKIQEILAEHHECRWMDTSELENCLRRIATEQKNIDDVKYKKLRTLAYDMYRKAQYLTTDASGLRKAMDAFQRFIRYEESKMEE